MTAAWQNSSHRGGRGKLGPILQVDLHQPSLFNLNKSVPYSIASLAAELPRRYPRNIGTRHMVCFNVGATVAGQLSYFKRWMSAMPRAEYGNRTCLGCRWNPRGKKSACCSGSGTCVNGWCACHQGSRGVDCADRALAGPAASHTIRQADRHAPTSSPALGQAVPSAHAQPRRRVPRHGVSIYVYQLPPELGGFTYGRRINAIYRAEHFFLDLLLRDASTRTHSPDEADLFYVPFFSPYGPVENSFCDRGRLELITAWLRRMHPFWDRRGGRDHIFFVSGDRGACGYGAASVRPILITHFGLLGPYALMEYGATAASARFNVSRQGLDGYLNATRNATELRRQLQDGLWCHAPHKDIVVPPFTLPEPHAPSDAPPGQHRYQLFHAGGVYSASGARATPFYSMGMRQRLYERFGGAAGAAAGLLILNRSASEAFFRASKFCLAPTGDGWGVRLARSVLTGCLPLIAQPFVMQPFEDLIDYHAFSRRIGLDVSQLPSVLAQPTTAELHQMHARLREVRAAFEWGADGLAYNFTILALCRRAADLYATQPSDEGADSGSGSGSKDDYGDGDGHQTLWRSSTARKAVESARPTHRRCASLAARLPNEPAGHPYPSPAWFSPELVEAVARLRLMRGLE